MLAAILVDNIRSEDGRVRGAIELRRWPDNDERAGDVAGIAFRCPCGCGNESWLPVSIGDRGWLWDGNIEKPTLTPSVLQSGLPCKWHGYLTAGEWRSC